MSSPIRPDDEGHLEIIADHRTPTSSRRAASIVARLIRPTIALSRDLARWASPNASAQPRARVHVASSIRSADLRADAWKTDRAEEGQQHPGDRQVGRRVSRAEIAEIDNRRETPFADQQIARVKVTVRPKRRARPRRRSHQPPPDVEDPVAINQPIELSHALVHDIVTIAQRTARRGLRGASAGAG